MCGADRRAVGYIVRNGGPRGSHVDVLVHRDAVYIVAGDGGVDGCDEAAWDQVMCPGLGVGVFGGFVRVRFFVCIEGRWVYGDGCMYAYTIAICWITASGSLTVTTLEQSPNTRGPNAQATRRSFSHILGKLSVYRVGIDAYYNIHLHRPYIICRLRISSPLLSSPASLTPS